MKFNSDLPGKKIYKYIYFIMNPILKSEIVSKYLTRIQKSQLY